MDTDEVKVVGENYTNLPALEVLTLGHHIWMDEEIGVAYPISGDATTLLNKKALA